jgi:hypothetical protein
MKRDMVFAAIAVAVIYFSPKLFFGIIVVITLVLLFEVFRLRNESRAEARASLEARSTNT